MLLPVGGFQIAAMARKTPHRVRAFRYLRVDDVVVDLFSHLPSPSRRETISMDSFLSN